LLSDSTLIATDIYKNKYGVFEGLFDKCYKLPHVEDSNYKKAFMAVIHESKPDVVLIMTEKEALFWGKHGFVFPAKLSPHSISQTAIDKAKLYRALSNTRLVPKHLIYQQTTDSFAKVFEDDFKSEPVWIRCFDEGSTAGKGSYLAKSVKEGLAWFKINSDIKQFLVSEVLPGRNYACNVLFSNGILIQHAIYERLEYFMPHLAPSGITGNISLGKLITDELVLRNSILAIRGLEKICSAKANGIYTVDLKGDKKDIPCITEINLRHTAATYAFAQGGWNMAEFQVLAVLGLIKKIPNTLPSFPKDNAILRDIDGTPIYVENLQGLLKKKVFDFSKLNAKHNNGGN
jgi:hypothetical protein